ncbi:MerR family transcriptional regulator [Mollicutes bacterium LVI A0039]|nr:MerR family transcriptional regulator [Mollicutes bacterium LVI A0039]
MKIDEVSKQLGLTKDTLRYYEKLGLIYAVPKSASGVREYDDLAIEHIKFIICMRNTGLTLKQIKNYIDLYNQGEQTHDERLEILNAQRQYVIEQITTLNESLEFLEYKIARYHNQKN